MFAIASNAATTTNTSVKATTETSVSADKPLWPTGPDQWTLSLAGSGFTATKGEATTAMGATVQLGHSLDLLLPSEIGVRQGINWLSRPDENAGSWALDTELYNGWKVVDYKSLQLLVGPHLGVAYGNVPTRWYFGPEAEARLWMKKDVYTFFRAGYDKNISDTRNDQDLMKYTVGVGFKF